MSLRLFASAALLWTLSATAATRGAGQTASTIEAAEVGVLWDHGRRYLSERRFEDCAYELRRLVDRYPGFAHATTAHLILGACLQLQGKHLEAIPPLRHFVHGLAKDPVANRARALLARSYLETGRFREAFHLTSEMHRAGGEAWLRQEALLLKAEALIGLGQDERARRALDSAVASAAAAPVSASPESATQDAELALRTDDASPEGYRRAQAAWLRVRIKARECSRLPSARKLDEGQARNQLARRGHCTLEAMIALRNVLETGDTAWAERATDDLLVAWTRYRKACEQPARPGGQRTRKELATHRRELREILLADFESNRLKGQEFIDAWKDSLPAPMLRLVGKVLKGLAPQSSR